VHILARQSRLGSERYPVAACWRQTDGRWIGGFAPQNPEQSEFIRAQQRACAVRGITVGVVSMVGPE